MSQIETIMLVALGFAIAALIALFLSRFFWAVALRLGNKRLLRSTPTTIAELRADRDRLRAEYAMLSRKLQLKMGNIKTRLAEQMAEVTRNRNRIDHLIVEVRTRDAMLADRAAEVTRLQAHVEPLEAELTDRTQSVQSSKRQLRDRDAELARHHKVVEQLRAEIAERDRRIEMLRNEAVGKDINYMLANNDVLTAQDRLRKRIADLTSLSSQIEAQRLQLAQQKSEFESLKTEIVRSIPGPVETEQPERRVFAPEPTSEFENLMTENARSKPGPVDTEAPERQGFASETAEPDSMPREHFATADESAPAALAAVLTDNLTLEEQLSAAESETRKINAELRKLDTSFSARIAELKIDNGDRTAEASPKPADNASENAPAPLRGKLRAVTNVISLAARIRALQKTAGE
jgi:myosin heavy subunit